jgi:hypothetical protein
MVGLATPASAASWSGQMWDQYSTDCVDGGYGGYQPVYGDNCDATNSWQLFSPGVGDLNSTQPPSAGGGAEIKLNGWCLDADANNRTNGAKVQLWACNGSPQQRWYLRPDATGNSLQNGLSWPYGMCLDKDTHTPGRFGVEQMWACNGTTEQTWNQGF